MSQIAAQQLLSLVAVIAIVVWATGVRFLIRSRRLAKMPRDDASAATFSSDVSPPPNVVMGRIELEGTPEVLSVKLASRLVSTGDARLGALLITERTAQRVCFESAPSSPGGQYGRLVHRGQVLLTPARSPDKTNIYYAVEVSSGRGLLIAGTVSCILGLAAIVAGYWAMQTFIVSSPDPAVRWQVFQSLQIVHFLWPPFLFGGLYRWRRRIVQDSFKALIHNLPYFETQ